MFSFRRLATAAVLAVLCSGQNQIPSAVSGNPGWPRVRALIDWYDLQNQTEQIASTWSVSGGEECAKDLREAGIKEQAAKEICSAANPKRVTKAPTTKADASQSPPRADSRKVETVVSETAKDPAPSARKPLTNDDIVKMHQAGTGDELLLSMVQQNPGKFVANPEDVIALKRAGVSDKVIAAMVTKRETAAASPAAPISSSGQVLIQDATPVRLRLNRTLSSADAKVGDSVDFEVLDELSVNGALVIARGATAVATVTEAQAKRRMARGGKLNVNIDYVRLTSGDKAALRAVKETKGGGHTGAMTGAMVATGIVFFPAAPLFLFMHGKDTVIPKGTEITAYINGDIKLERDKFAK